MSPATFRFALIISLALAIASAVFEYFAQARLPPTVSAAIAKLGESAPLWRAVVAMLAGIASLATGLISIFGLFFFKQWAPSLAVNSTLLAGATLLLLPPALTHGESEALTMYSMTLWGAVLAFSKSDSYKTWNSSLRTDA